MRLLGTSLLILCVACAASAQSDAKPTLTLSCTANKPSYLPQETADLTIAVENQGTSTFYVYNVLEWGWAGIGIRLVDDSGRIVPPKSHIIPLPPPPISKKELLVRIEPGYFYGTHLYVALSHYSLKPGVYFLQASYRSNWSKQDGFGLPLVTSDDGEFLSEKVRIVVR